MERVVKRGQDLKSFGVLKSRVTIEKNPMHLLKKDIYLDSNIKIRGWVRNRRALSRNHSGYVSFILHFRLDKGRSKDLSQGD